MQYSMHSEYFQKRYRYTCSEPVFPKNLNRQFNLIINMESYWKAILGIYIAGALLVLVPPIALLIGFNDINQNGKESNFIESELYKCTICFLRPLRTHNNFEGIDSTDNCSLLVNLIYLQFLNSSYQLQEFLSVLLAVLRVYFQSLSILSWIFMNR